MARKKKEKLNGANGDAEHEPDVAVDEAAEPEPIDEAVAAFVATAEGEPAPDEVTPKRTRYLRHELTKKEHRHMGQAISEHFKTIEDEEARLANLTDEVKRTKGKIAGLESDNRRLSRTMRDGYEFRDVECEERRDERLFQVDTVRLDTGEIIESRPFTAKERQGDLFPVEHGFPTVVFTPETRAALKRAVEGMGA